MMNLNVENAHFQRGLAKYRRKDFFDGGQGTQYLLWTHQSVAALIPCKR